MSGARDMPLILCPIALKCGPAHSQKKDNDTTLKFHSGLLAQAIDKGDSHMEQIFLPYVGNFLWMSVLLLVGVLLRAKVKLLQKFLFPSAIIAEILGFILMSLVEVPIANGGVRKGYASYKRQDLSDYFLAGMEPSQDRKPGLMNVMKGYYIKPDATAEAFEGTNWLLTGDLAKKNEDGYFYIVDRKKDMIIRGGYNVYPRKIEEVLLTHNDVSMASIIGTPLTATGKILKKDLKAEYAG